MNPMNPTDTTLPVSLPTLDALGLADLEGYQEQLTGFNPEADANAPPQVMTERVYLMKVTQIAPDPAEPEKLWQPKATKKTGARYLNTSLRLEVVENPANPKEFWGRRFTEQNVMSLVMEQTGTTGIQAVVQALGKGSLLMNGPMDHTRQAQVLSAVLQGEPMIGVELGWEASDYDTVTEKDLHPRVRGMKRFPKDPAKPGEYLTTYQWSDGTEAAARNYRKRWTTVAEATNPPVKGKGTAAGGGVGSGSAGVPSVNADQSAPKSAAPKPGAGPKR